MTLYLLSFKLNQQKLFLDTDSDKETGCTHVLTNGYFVEQNFYTDHEFEMVLQLCIITWGSSYSSDDLLKISIIDHETETVIYTTEYKANSFTDHKLSRFLILEGAKLEATHWYGIRIESNIMDESKPIAISCVENNSPEITNVVSNGEAVSYNLRMKIYE